MDTTIDILKSGKYTNAWIAAKLYPELKRTTATAKFHNKLHNVGYRKFTNDEIKQIEIILK